MIVTPDEIANICTIFFTLKARKMLLGDLLLYTSSSLSIDSTSNAVEILNEAKHLKLIETKDNYCYLSKLGFKIAKIHASIKPSLCDKTKDSMLKLIYLNPVNNNLYSIQFIQKFYPDSEYGTFICHRNKLTSSIDIKFTLILQRLGLIKSSNDKIVILPKYLGLINSVLHNIRINNENQFIENKNINKILTGDIAENLAFEYEKQRLIDNGFSELSNLVQKISQIDYSAGYDIISFLGEGNNFLDPIYIEVKGTEKKHIYFYWSRNEQQVANQKKESYYLYLYTNIDKINKTGKGPQKICNPIINIYNENYVIETQDLLIKENQT